MGLEMNCTARWYGREKAQGNRKFRLALIMNSAAFGRLLDFLAGARIWPRRDQAPPAPGATKPIARAGCCLVGWQGKLPALRARDQGGAQPFMEPARKSRG